MIDDEFDPKFIKCLSLASGDKIITYTRNVTELGSYICERPFSTYIDPEEGSYILMQFQPYADGTKAHLFQPHGVIAISEVSDYGRRQYLAAVEKELEYEASKLDSDIQTIDDLFEEIEKNISTNSEEEDSAEKVVDLKNWKPKTDTTKH